MTYATQMIQCPLHESEMIAHGQNALCIHRWLNGIVYVVELGDLNNQPKVT
jgi:hypothetical protein